MQSLVKCVVAGVLLLAIVPAWGQPTDPLVTKLGFGARSNALPAWNEPTLVKREELAAFIDRASRGVLLVGYRKPVAGRDQFESGTGTAWVLSSKHRLLATNAHVAEMIVVADGHMMAIVNGTTYIYRIVRHWYHPGVLRIKELGGGQVPFVHSTDPAAGATFPHCPDLAVVQLSEDGPDLPFEWQMATPEELQHISPGLPPFSAFLATIRRTFPTMARPPSPRFTMAASHGSPTSRAGSMCLTKTANGYSTP